MNTYAFIDVSNTIGTTNGCLGFSIDWSRLYLLLTNKKWECKDIYFYKGHKGKKEKQQLDKMAEGVGYKIRTKLTHIHPDISRDVNVICPACNEKFVHEETVKGRWKSNCDVELSVDAVNVLSSGDEALIFTGDGDFAYLIEDLIGKGVHVRIVSSTKRDMNNNKRFSTRLNRILDREESSGEKRASFLHIDSWRYLIQKENCHEA